ncbi:hypothetical protein V5799_007505, partial [Amblyomma americanum]
MRCLCPLVEADILNTINKLTLNNSTLLQDVRTWAAPVSLTVLSFKPCSDLRGCQRAGRQDLGYGRRLVCSELQALFRSSRLPESRHCYYAVGASMPGQYPRSPARLTCPPSRPAKKEPQCQTTFRIAVPVVLVKAPIRSAAATVSSQAHYSSPHKEELGALDVERKHNLRASGVASSAVNFGSCPASCRCQRVVNSGTPSVQRCPVDVHGAQHEQHVQHGCLPLRLWRGSGASLQLWLCLRHTREGLTVSLQRERCSGGQLTSMEPSASNMSGIGTAKNSVRRDFGADTKQTCTNLHVIDQCSLPLLSPVRLTICRAEKFHRGDIKMGTVPGFAPALLLLLSTAASVDIDTSDGGYNELRVSISDNIPPDESIIDNIE